MFVCVCVCVRVCWGWRGVASAIDWTLFCSLWPPARWHKATHECLSWLRNDTTCWSFQLVHRWIWCPHLFLFRMNFYQIDLRQGRRVSSDLFGRCRCQSSIPEQNSGGIRRVKCKWRNQSIKWYLYISTECSCWGINLIIDGASISLANVLMHASWLY